MLFNDPALTLTREGSVFRITLCDVAQDNTITHATLDAWNTALDMVCSTPGDCALVIGSSVAKTFCIGINLQWLAPPAADDAARFVRRLEDLFLRVATLDLPTIAEINGNCYAGGAILAAACDIRLMRADRGRFCYSEVRIKIPFTAAMLEVIRLIPNSEALYELAISADAWGGEKCSTRGVVHEALPLHALAARASVRAGEMATKDRSTFTAIKRGLRDRATALALARGLIEPPRQMMPTGLLAPA